MEKLPKMAHTSSSTDSLVRMWSEKLSRKNFAIRAGRFALQLIGITFVSALPIDRIVRVAEGCGVGNCAPWQLCGINGTLCCSSCTSDGGTLNTCPNCATKGLSSWAACCRANGAGCISVSYHDCCSNVESCNCDACTDCPNDPSNGFAWCGGLQNYACTVATTGSVCTCPQ